MSAKKVYLKFLIFFFTILILSFSGFSVYGKEYEISNYDLEMNLSEEGDFLVEERITFHFLSGDFSYAYREVERNVFSALEFISIEGVNTSIRDYELKQGRDLGIKWYYDYLGNQATFVFRYIGREGLQSINERNVINWTPTGSEWDVPIRDLDIWINLPWPVEDLELEPAADIQARSEQQVHFHHELLPSGEEYKVYLSFPEQIMMVERKGSNWQSKDIFIFLAIIFAGLILLVTDLIRRDRVLSKKGKYSIDDLLICEKAVLFNNLYDTKKGITVQIFELAKKGKIKLVSSLKDGGFWGKKAEVSVEVLDRENLSEIEKKIVNKLEKDHTLEKFFQDYRWFSRMDKDIKDLLRTKGFISRKAEFKRSRIYTSSLLFIIPAIVILVLGIVYNYPILIGTAVALFILAIGRLIKGAMFIIMTPEALYLKEKIVAEIEGKKKVLETLIKEKDNNGALKYFFQEIEYISLQKYFHAGTMDKYKKSFKKADEIEVPGWIELDTSELGSTLDALEIVELMDYLFLSMLLISTSTSTPTTTGGMGGGTAGGGGGGAG